MDSVLIRKLTEIVHDNLENENFGVKELALAAGMSRSTVHRRLRSFLKKSASQFIREVRLQKGMEMLKEDIATASEISYKVGFNSPTYFSTCFHQYFGYPPGEVKKRNLIYSNETINQTDKEPDPEVEKPKWKSLRLINQISFNRRAIFVASFVILTLVFLTLFIMESTIGNFTRSIPRDKSIAVLPFRNLSDNPENQYFTEGVMEDILNHLFRIKELRVISRTTGERYRGRNISAPEIARELGVNFILEGSVQQYEGKVRIIAQLINARHDQHIWTQKYDRELADIFIIQSSIAKQIADELQTVLSTTEIEHIEKIPTRNPEAYKLYLQGRFLWNRRTEEGLKKSVEYFKMALAADPQYAMAYTGLADAYFVQAWQGWIPRKDGYEKSKDYALYALELDKNLAESHTTIGALLCWNEWKWEAASKELTLAIELNQNYPLAHQYYSELLDIIGNIDKAREQINLALQDNPFSAELHVRSALFYYHEGKFEESLAECRQAEKLDPTSILIYWRYFYTYFWKGEDLKAAETLQKIIGMDTSTLKYATSVKQVFGKSGINGLLKWLIEIELSKSDPNPLTLARLYSILAKKTEALAWLETAFKKHSPGIPEINIDPDFEILRRDPKFKEIINKMGLSDFPVRTVLKKSHPK